MRVNAWSGKTERFGDLGNRIRTFGQDIQNLLLGSIWQQSVLGDLGPRIAVGFWSR